MVRQKNTRKNQPTVKVGNLSNISGNVNVAGGSITTHQTTTGLSAAEIKGLFDQLYARIDARPNTPSTDKEDLKAEVKEIQATVTEAAKENKKMDENFLARRFRTIARMAPDILEVVVATLANPLAGLGVAVKKVAERARTKTTP